MHQPFGATHPAFWVRVSLMTWCPLLPLLFPPSPTWKICTTATNTGHGGLWCSFGSQHPGLSERAGGTFWAADPSPWGGASQRHPPVRACQPAAQPPYQPTSSMAAGGDAGKSRQHAGQPTSPLSFSTTNLRYHVSALWSDILALPSEQAHSTIMSAHGHCFSFLVVFNNLSVQFPCDLGCLFLCLYPLSWMLCNNLPCGDSFLKADENQSLILSPFAPPFYATACHSIPSPFAHWSLILSGGAADWMWPFARLWLMSVGR